MMFAYFMIPTWEAATIAAVVAGVIGFFVVLRGETFPAHAISNGAFAGAAGSTLLGLNPLLGLAACSLLGATSVAALRRRASSDVATALVLVTFLAVGAAFLSQTTTYEGQVIGLLFGTLFGVSHIELVAFSVVGALCVVVTVSLFKQLLITSLSPDIPRHRGLSTGTLNAIFLTLVAAATTLSIPVVGTFLVFSLMVGPPAVARRLTNQPGKALGLSVIVAILVAWTSIASSYATNWPVGFFVGTYAGVLYVLTSTATQRNQ